VAPDNDERIQRMEQEGVLSSRQADMLRDSLRTGASGESASAAAGRRRSLPSWVAWGLLGLLLIGFILAALNGGGPATIQDVTQSLNQPGGHGEMNRSFSILLAVGLLFVVPLLFFTYLHNSLVGKEEKVSESWAQTESNFQRRADLIPALVETVSRYTKHERETLSAVTQERAGAAKSLAAAVDELLRAQKESAAILREKGPKVIEDEALLRRLYETQNNVGRGMGAVFALAEAYPTLRASDQFLELQAQLEGTENRINVARMRFNDAVGDYNATLRMLPWNVVASLGNFQRKAYFRSEEESRNAPDLKFN
jgi:LemA protein